MSREEAAKLLGGYATNSLTPEEREALFSAALDDQALFDELAREESLRQLLAQPGVKQDLLAALDTAAPQELVAAAAAAAPLPQVAAAPEPWYRSWLAWIGHPGGLAATAVAFALVIAASVWVQYESSRPKPALVTEMRKPQASKPFEPPVEEARKEPETLPPPPQLAPPPVAAAESGAVLDSLAVGKSRNGASGLAGGVVGGVIETQQMAKRAGAPPPAVMSAPAAPQAAVRAKAEAEAKALFEAQPGGGAAVSAFRQEGPRSAAREIAADAANAPVAAAPYLGLRYSLLRRAPDGQFVETDPATVFTTGEPVRLAFESNDVAYLYVLQREVTGGWRLLFSDRVPRRTRVQVPPSGALQYSESGPKELYAVLSRNPEPVFANLQPGVLDQKLRGALIMERAQGSRTGSGGALYIVNTGNLPQAQQVAFAITLSFRQP